MSDMNKVFSLGTPTACGVKALELFNAPTAKIDFVTIEGMQESFYCLLTYEDLQKLANAIAKETECI